MTIKTHGVTGFAVSLATSGVYMASQAGTTDAKMHFGMACAIGGVQGAYIRT